MSNIHPLEVILARPDAADFYNKWVAIKSKKDPTVLAYGDCEYVYKEIAKLNLTEGPCILYVPAPSSILQ